MKPENSISALFNVKKGEGSKIVLLMAYTFLLGLSMAYFFTISTTLFLTKFDNSVLPIAYMCGGVLTWVAGMIYSHFQKKTDFSKLLKFSVYFLAISISCFIVIQMTTTNKWVYFIMFAWFSVSMFIYQIGFWQLSTSLFDLRQGKRLFGLITAGEVISSIISFLSIPILLKILSTENMLLISMLGVASGAVLLTFSLTRFSLDSLPKNNTINQPIENPEQKTEIYNRNFILFVFILAILPTFATYFVDFIFFTQSKTEFPEKQVLAAFLGTFLGIMSILELLIRTVISGKLLDKYGVKLGLLFLPAILIFCFLFAAVAGSIYGTIGVFFSFISLAKLFMRIVRTSLHEPSFQILYQIIPIENRLSFQTKIETGKAIGHILVGFILLIFTWLEFSLIVFSFIFLIILGFWIYVGLNTFYSYRASLKNLIQNINETSNIALSDNGIRFANTFLHSEISKLEYALHITYQTNPEQSNKFVAKLLENSRPQIRNLLAHTAYKRGLANVLPLLEKATISNGNDPSIKECIEKIKNYKAKTSDELNKIISESTKEEKIIALYFSGNTRRYETLRVLSQKLTDADIGIRKAAISAAGVLRKKELFPYILDCLVDERYSAFAAQSIVLYGEEILNELENHFIRMENNTNVQFKILEIYEKINNKKSISLLRNKINYPDKNISTKALISLSKLNYQANHSESSVINQNIITELGDIVWLSKCYTELAAAENTEVILSAISDEIEKKRERIYLLLSLIYEAQTISQIQNNLESGNPNLKGYALEILDMLVTEENKILLLPFFEKLSPEETIHSYRNSFPQENLKITERIASIINHDYTKINLWIKALAIDYLKFFDTEETRMLLCANLVNSNTVMQETAAFVLQKNNAELYFDEIIKHKNINRKIHENLNRRNQSKDVTKYPLIIEKIEWMTKNEILSHFYQADLIEIAEKSQIFTVEKNVILENLADYTYLLIKGSLSTATVENKKLTLKEFELAGDISETYFKSETKDYICNENSILLKIPKYSIYNLLSSDTNILHALIEL